MIGGTMARLRERFRDQFTPVERGWAYRRGSRGPALPVGDEDRAMLIAGFDRAIRWLAWGGFLGSMLMWGMLDWLRVEISYWTAALPYMAIWSAFAWLAWNAPHRLLNGRAPLAPGISARQARRDGLRTLSWIVIIAGLAVSILMAVQALAPGPWSAAKLGNLGLAALFLAFFAAIAWAKRRAMRD